MKGELTRRQSRLLRIPGDVPCAVGEVLRVANQPVEIVLLPKFSRSSQPLVDLVGGETLPGVHHCLQGMSIVNCDQHMDVIRHDHPGVMGVAPTFKMTKALCHDATHPELTQQALAMPRIQPAFRLPTEAFVILQFIAKAPGLGMDEQPAFALHVPLFTQRDRNGVSQTKGDEVAGSRLLPVRQFVRRFFNLPIRVQKYKLVGFHAQETRWRPRAPQAGGVGSPALGAGPARS